MQELNCLIVEDEPLAAEVIKDYISLVSGLTLVETCEDVFSANAVMQRENIDLIFLDINLPTISGIDFIKSLNQDYDIILTTAYHQYAVEGFNLDVVDYLLKPVEFSRFLKAVNKVLDKTSPGRPPDHKQNDESASYFFNTGRRQVKVNEEDIVYIESLKDYVKIHTTDSEIVTKSQIGKIKEIIMGKNLIRVHKSYIINLNKITAFTATDIELGEKVIPIGRTYKELIEQILSRLSG